jgi:hypothetical protein
VTITLRLIHETDTGTIGQAADAWARLATALDDRLDEFTADSRDLPDVWPSGADAEKRAVALRREIADVHEPCQRISQALRTHADSLWQLQGMLDGILSECAGNGVTVDLAGGTVSAGTAQAAQTPGLIDGYTAQLQDLLTRATRLDADTRTVLQACMPAVGSGFGAAGGPATPMCPTDELLGRPPAEVNDWWNGLTRSQQDRMIQDFPRQIGGLDGIPADDRDEANRLALARQKQEVLARMAVEHGNLPELREQMQRITKVEEALGKLGDRGYLLAVDTEAYGGHGKVAVAVGNPDTARHTGVWVPGLSTTLYGAMDDNLDRVMRMNEAADRLTGGRGGDVSTVYWLGYDAPDLDNASVLANGRAESARDPYLGFMNGLRATHEGEPGHLVAMGHSYGSTVVGEAARTGNLPVDDIVVAGSPGMHVSGAGQLTSDPQHVWAGASSTDPVADAKFAEPWDKILFPAAAPAVWAVETAADATHGDAPTSGGFGGNNWVADTGGHTSYWEPASESLNNQARVLAGRYDKVTLNSGTIPEAIR